MPTPNPTDTRLPSVVTRLGWISFFADICSEMAYPILPFFLTGALKVPVAVVGLIEGASEAVVSLTKAWSGRWSDQIGRRMPFVQWGYGLSALGKPILAAAALWPVVLGGRLVDRFGKGLRTTARDAMIADAAPPSLYGKAYGFHRAMDTAGAFVGVGIALGLLWMLPGQYRLILVLAVVPGVVSWFLALRLREPAPRISAQADRVPLRAAVAKFPAAYWRALALCLLFGLANTSDVFLMLQAKNAGLSEPQAILAYMAYNLVVVLVSTHAGMLSDRLGRWRLLFGAWLLYAAVYATFPLVSGAAIWGLFALYGLYYGMSQGVSKALVADCSPAEVRATAIGLFSMAAGFATLLGNVAMGAIWDRLGPEAAMYSAAGVAAAAALLIPLTRLLVPWR